MSCMNPENSEPASPASHPSATCIQISSREGQRPEAYGASHARNRSCRVPYFLDLVHGSTGYQPLVVLCFVFILIIAFYSVFNLVFVDTTVRMTNVYFGSRPAKGALLGRPFSPFKVYVNNEAGAPVPNATVTAAIVGLSDAALRVELNTNELQIRLLNCFRHYSAPDTVYSHEDDLLCSTKLRNFQVDTGTDGAAVFENLTVVSATPGSYVMLLSVTGDNVVGEVTVEHLFTLETSLVDAGFEFKGPLNDYNQPFGYEGFIIFGAMEDPVTLSQIPAQTFAGAQCTVVSLDIDQRFAHLPGQELDIVIPNRGGPKVAFLENAVYTIQPEDIMHYGDYSLIFIKHTGIKVLASRESDFYLGVQCFGKTVGFAPNGWDPTAAPLVVDPAFRLPSAIKTLEVTRYPEPEAVEGVPFAVQPTVCVKDANGVGIPGKRVVAWMLGFAGIWLPDFTTRRPNYPPSAPKFQRLLYPVSPPTGADGCATFERLTASVAPHSAEYTITFMADGIANLEPPYESLFDVDVKSAVDKAFPIMEPIRAPDAPFSFKSTVVVGEDWDVLPSVRLVDAQGSPVAGKEVIMMVDPQSADKEFDDLGILYSALASNADGWVYFTFARVAFAVREGAYTFRVLYDLGSKGPPTATVFTLNVVYPTTPDLRQCTFVQVNNTQIVGQAMLVTFPFPAITPRAVDYMGRPTGSPVFLRLKDLFDTIAPVRLVNMTNYKPATLIDDHQVFGPATSFTDVAIAAMDGLPFSMMFTFSCDGRNEQSIPFSVNAIPQMNSVQVTNIQQVSSLAHELQLQVNTLTGNPPETLPSAPPFATLKVIQVPRYADDRSWTEYDSAPVLVADPALVDPLTGLGTMTVQFNPVMFSHAPVGTYKFLVEIQGVSSNVHSITIPDPVQSITIVQPAVPDRYASDPMAVAIFDPSAFTPMVLQLTPAPGQSVTGVAIEVVLRSCTNCEKNLSTAEFELLPPWEIPFEGGRLLYSEWKGQYGAMWPLYSAAANASGAITFPYLLLMGGRQNRIFQVCYQYGMRHTACEKGYFRTARNLKVEVVKEMSTVAVPGVAVRNPPIALPAAEDGTPIPTLVLAAVVDEYISPAKLDTSTAFAMATDAGATFQGLKFRRSSQHGKCNLKFLVPGAESPATMGITLTQQPSQIRFAIPPRPYVLVGGSASQVAIASVIPDGSPVPDTFITCSVQMTRDTKERLMLEQEQRPRDKKLPYKGCIPAAGNCGRMPPQLSKATTLQDGRAYISMVIPEAPPGMYQLKCSGKVSGPDVELQTAVSEAKAGDTAEARANDVAESVAAMTKILLQGEAMPSLASVMSSLSVGSNKAVKNSLELLSEPFQVFNNVAEVQITEHPILEGAFNLPFSFKPSLNMQPKEFHRQPVVRVLDPQGNPVAQRKVWVGAYPAKNAMLLQWDQTVSTDADGYYRFKGLRTLRGNGKKDYQLVFACQGVVSEPSEKFELKPVPGLKAQWESMKYVVLILFVCMFPIFAAGWPAPSRLRWFWVVLAAGVLGGGGYFTWVMYLKVPVEAGPTVWLWAAIIMVLVAYFSLCFFYLVLVFLIIKSGSSPEYADRLMGVAKAKEAYEYVTWMVNHRLPPSERAWHEWVASADPRYIVHKPPKELMRHSMPLRFLLALGMCLYLLPIFILFMVWVWVSIQSSLFTVQNKVPKPQGITWEEGQLINQLMLQTVRSAFDDVTNTLPQLMFLYKGLRFLEGIDFIGLWEKVHDAAFSLNSSAPYAGALAATIPIAICAVTWYLLIANVKNNLLLMRKGRGDPELKALVSHNNSETYPAHQVMHFLVGYLIQFFVFFIILLIVTNPHIMVWVWNTFSGTIIQLIIIIGIRAIIVQIAKRTLLDGHELKHPRLYHYWANVNLVYFGLVTAMFQVIIRFIKCILFIALYFIRLDKKILTGLLARLDAPWVGYWSTLFLEHRFHNPIRKIFLAYLCMHRYHPWDLHPSIAAMVTVLQQQDDFGFRGVSRVKRRWWLALTLVLNPSIICMRAGRYTAILPVGLLAKLTSCCRPQVEAAPDNEEATPPGEQSKHQSPLEPPRSDGPGQGQTH